MAVTFALASSSPNRLLYLVTATAAGAGTISNATLLADSQGPIHQIAAAQTNGYGTAVAGVALTQAQARSLLLNDGVVAKPQCRTTVQGRTGGSSWDVDANVSGGNPIITVTAGAAGDAYVAIDVQGAIG